MSIPNLDVVQVNARLDAAVTTARLQAAGYSIAFPLWTMVVHDGRVWPACDPGLPGLLRITHWRDADLRLRSTAPTLGVPNGKAAPPAYAAGSAAGTVSRMWHGCGVTELVDLGLAATELKRILAGATSTSFSHPTPCADFTVGDLLEHCRMAAATLTAAAERGGSDRVGDSRSATEDLPTRVAAEIDQLVIAWREPDLMEVQNTTAGGITMPVEFHNMIAVQELLLHGWDLAVATDQVYGPDPATVSRLHTFLREAAADSPRDGSGPFGPPVEVPEGATALDHLLALSGRNPRWQPG